MDYPTDSSQPVVGPIFPQASDPKDNPALVSTDDDIGKYDVYLKEQAGAISAADLPTRVTAADENPTPSIGSLNLRAHVLDPTWAPLQVLNTQPARIKCTVTATITAGTIYISDEAQFISGGIGAAGLTAGFGLARLTTTTTVDLSGYCGPLWAWSDTAGNIINVISVINPTK